MDVLTNGILIEEKDSYEINEDIITHYEEELSEKVKEND